MLADCTTAANCCSPLDCQPYGSSNLCCSKTSGACGVDLDCCSINDTCVGNLCTTSGSGGSGGSGACAVYHQFCVATTGCCDGLSCVNSECCAKAGQVCGVDSDCCSLSNTCNSGTCG
jgi:hypothetical protein